MQKTGLSKGRVSQIFDPSEPFGEVAARNLATKLRLRPDYFESDAPLTTPLAGARQPEPVNAGFRDRHQVTPSEWALLQDIKDALSSPRLAQKVTEIRTEVEELRAFAENVMKKRNPLGDKK